MSVTVFIGDELSAAGYRLCGVDTQIADSGNVVSLVEQACEYASLLLLSSSVAQTLEQAQLDALMEKLSPPVLIVPAIAGQSLMPDIAGRIHKQLGMLE